jgi:hypothetical protein
MSSSTLRRCLGAHLIGKLCEYVVGTRMSYSLLQLSGGGSPEGDGDEDEDVDAAFY